MQDADQLSPLDDEHNVTRVLLERAHVEALNLTFAALCRGEDVPPLTEDEFLLATLETQEDET